VVTLGPMAQATLVSIWSMAYYQPEKLGKTIALNPNYCSNYLASSDIWTRKCEGHAFGWVIYKICLHYLLLVHDELTNHFMTKVYMWEIPPPGALVSLYFIFKLWTTKTNLEFFFPYVVKGHHKLRPLTNQHLFKWKNPKNGCIII
jgi:hypothetical protein